MNDLVSSTLTGPPLTLTDIKVGGSGLPSRGVVHGTEGNFAAANKAARAKQSNQSAEVPQAPTHD